MKIVKGRTGIGPLRAEYPHDKKKDRDLGESQTQGVDHACIIGPLT